MPESCRVSSLLGVAGVEFFLLCRALLVVARKEGLVV